ncbi:MAG: hypothetical protein JO127_18195 [Caulobacteraceae bacterium]|nr:hypothetical protein [Caulobacteraceae bacterium]
MRLQELIGSLRRDERGATAVVVALTLPLVIAGAAFGVEVGYWRYDQVRVQQAADAAAYAGAVVKRAGGANYSDAATTAATSNGYASASDTITVNAPSTATPGDANSVEVVISRTETPMFTAMFSNHAAVVKASATASFSSAGSACILALNHSAAKATDFAGNSSIALNGCSVMSNSLASNSVNVQGSASLTAPCIYSAGGASQGGTVTLTTCGAVKTHQPPVADPYASLVMPTVSGSCSNGNATSPGHYCSMSLKNTKTLGSGVYIIDGGTLDINANANISCSGCTFYLVNGASVTMNGNSHVSFSAPTSGTYAGMLFISDRSNTGSITINGDSTSQMTGAIYSSSGAVNYIGNFSGANGCTQIVANTVSWSGNTSFSDAVTASCPGMQQVKVGSVVRLSA